MKSRRICSLCIVSILAFARAHACDVVGRVDGLLLDKVKVTKLDPARMSIVREGKTLGIDDGMPVCKDDLIAARAGVVANVRAGNDAEHDNIVTLYGEATITVESTTSITARLGRIFALLRGTFDVRTNFGKLAAISTQFEVDATPGSAKVVQIEGEIQVSQDGAAAGPRVRPLEQLNLSVPAQKPTTLGTGQCAAVTAAHSNVVSSTRPELPFEASGRSADRASVAREFASARERVLCAKQADAIPELARAWADYAEPGGVLKLMKSSEPTAGGRDPAIYANSAGNAYRQIGQSDAAITWYKRALETDPQFAFPYNGIGDAQRDRGLVALSKGDSTGAMKEFDVAELNYRKSLDENLWGKGGGTNRAIPMVNLGELALLRIAADPAQAAAQIDIARQWFDGALKQSPGYAFAELGLARVDFMRALVVPNVEVQGPKEWERLKVQLAADLAADLARKPHVNAARLRLRDLINAHPGFSAASLLAGEVHQTFGSADDAQKHFRDAIRFDPHNVLAYYRLSQVLKSDKQRAERELYAATFRSAAYPAQVSVMEGRAKVIEAAKPKAEVRDVRALSASISTVTFGSNYESQSIPVKFTNDGSAAVTVSAVKIGGKDAGAFEMRDGCSNRQLPPGGSCEIFVSYRRTGEQNQSAQLVVSSSSGIDAKVALKAIPRVQEG